MASGIVRGSGRWSSGRTDSMSSRWSNEPDSFYRTGMISGRGSTQADGRPYQSCNLFNKQSLNIFFSIKLYFDSSRSKPYEFTQNNFIKNIINIFLLYFHRKDRSIIIIIKRFGDTVTVSHPTKCYYKLKSASPVASRLDCLNDERTNHAPSQPFKRWTNQSRTFTTV